MNLSPMKNVSNKTIFLQVFTTMFFPLLIIITVIIAGFDLIRQPLIINPLRIENLSPITLIFLWTFLCGGVGICCYLLARGFSNRIQSEEELVRYRNQLEEVVKERTDELEIANQLLQRSEERSRLVKEIASAANADDNTEEVLLVAIRSIAKNMQWPIGHVYIIDSDNLLEMVSTDMWYMEEPTRYQDFKKITEKIRFGVGQGLPGRVLEAKKTIIIKNIAEASNFPRAIAAANSDLNAGIAVPVFIKGEVVAVLEFFAREIIEVGSDVIFFVEEIGEQIGLFMERKQGEEALRREQEKAQQYLNIAGSVVVVIGEDENLKLVNKAGLKLLGYSEQELLGKNWFNKVVPIENREMIRELFHNAINSDGKTFEFNENVISIGDGTQKLISWHNVPIYDKNKKTIGILASGEDITEHRKVDKELRKLSQAVEQSPVSVLITDRYGRIEYVNQKFCERTHYKAEEVIGRNPRILKSGTLPHSFYQELWQTILKGEIWRGDFLNKTKDDQQYWERASISSIMDDMGEITNFIAIKEDITEQKEMEEELLQAKVEAELSNKAKGDFLANMSHEIRTPMNAVIGLTHLALQTELLPKQQDYLQKISVSSQSLLSIINDILDYSKFAAGKLIMENIQFNLWKVIEDVNTILYCKAEEKGIEMVLSVGKNVPMGLRGDPYRLQQILLNLLSNAVKFTNQGEVVLSVKLMKRKEQRVQLEFSVRDTGIGMSEEEKSRLFNPFTQADGSTTRKYGGTGLGLVISKQLVEMMNGAMHVKSSFGQGSEFAFTADFGVEKDEKLASIFENNLQNLKVLVIDDNESSRLAFKEILEKLTVRVSLAKSGEEGIDYLLKYQGRDPFDLILLDWVMPGMNGLETGRRIRNHSQWSDIPIIIVASHSEEAIREQGKKLNLDGFLIKPVTPSLLFNTMVEALGKEKCQRSHPLASVMAFPPEWKQLQGARILLVEDNEINLQVAREIMEKKNIIVTVAHNGREAVQLIQDRKFDGVLMDIQMPEMDGLEATGVIRNELGLQELPIIAMTADVVAERIQIYLATGMNDCIFKPINVAQMFTTLCKWITPELLTLDSVKQIVNPINNYGEKVAEEADIFQLPGINMENTLLRLGNNKKLYYKLLLQFLESNEDTCTTLTVAMEKGDYPLMLRQLHSLKGVAGNIGAENLYGVIRELEHTIANQDVEKIKGKMELFSHMLFAVMDSIRSVKDIMVEVTVLSIEDEKDTQKTFHESKEIMESLKDYLENYDTEAILIFEKLKALPIAVTYQVQFKKLQTAINNYDFEGALEELKELTNNFCE